MTRLFALPALAIFGPLYLALRVIAFLMALAETARFAVEDAKV